MSDKCVYIAAAITAFVVVVGGTFLEVYVNRQKCYDYAKMTGREIQLVSGECYVRTGDHFVPRSEYGRRP